MVLQTLHSTKKTFYYNFFPSKAEEESSKARKGPVGSSSDVVGRVLVEMRDIYPPPVLDPDNPWCLRKTLNHYEIAFGKLVLSSNDMFEHVIRYWSLGMANYVALGQKVGVTLWDVTEEENPRTYRNNDVYLQMMANDDCVLSCMELVKERKLKVDDEIGMYWDSKETSFKFKVWL
ncbi:hypothetical protein Salat_0578600 [Sesamum alatum]|uniref:Uncharacterized protein n=1 Tax=Sesamum alatum TaxID=300844 RepID=A0AAE1YPF8_9LAMI|nr:hypothetical protein Salat_0578600 [Sesamum alatum]